MKKFISLAMAAIALMLATSSCSSSKQSISYFDNLENSNEGSLGDVNYELRIVPDDELAITVSSVNPGAAIIYNLPLSYTPIVDPNTGLTNYQASGGNRNYLVDPDGNITFPVLGKLHVAGMTPREVADMIDKRLRPDIEDPIITVELANFKVSILGEVNRPGIVSANSERFSILDAIARAGDLSPYALRDNILLIRETNGKKEYHRINLNDSEVFTSPYFYLKQNDMLIVEPNDVRRANVKYNVNNGYKIQVTSAIISASSVIASLVIALAIK